LAYEFERPTILNEATLLECMSHVSRVGVLLSRIEMEAYILSLGMLPGDLELKYPIVGKGHMPLSDCLRFGENVDFVGLNNMSDTIFPVLFNKSIGYGPMPPPGSVVDRSSGSTIAPEPGILARVTPETFEARYIREKKEKAAREKSQADKLVDEASAPPTTVRPTFGGVDSQPLDEQYHPRVLSLASNGTGSFKVGDIRVTIPLTPGEILQGQVTIGRTKSGTTDHYPTEVQWIEKGKAQGFHLPPIPPERCDEEPVGLRESQIKRRERAGVTPDMPVKVH